jgi:hypothetical protein
MSLNSCVTRRACERKFGECGRIEYRDCTVAEVEMIDLPRWEISTTASEPLPQPCIDLILEQVKADSSGELRIYVDDENRLQVSATRWAQSIAWMAVTNYRTRTKTRVITEVKTRVPTWLWVALGVAGLYFIFRILKGLKII